MKFLFEKVKSKEKGQERKKKWEKDKKLFKKPTRIGREKEKK